MQISEMVGIISDFSDTCDSNELNQLLHMFKRLSEKSYSWEIFPGRKYPLALKKFYGALSILSKQDATKLNTLYRSKDEHFVTIFSNLCLFLLSDGISIGKQIPAPTTLDIVQCYAEIQGFYDALEELKAAQSMYSIAANNAEMVGISPSALKKYQPEISTLLCSLKSYVDSF